MSETFSAEIYRKLVEAVDALPEKAVERTRKEDTRKGYDTTGYQYQYLVNVLNEVVGPAGWEFTYETVNVVSGTFRSGTQFYDITVSTPMRILDARRTCVGGHVSGSYGDALKGAITNSLKKTMGLFGIGKAAYEGSLDDDYKPVPDMSLASVQSARQDKKAPETAEETAPCDNASCTKLAKTRYGKLCWGCSQHVKKGGTVAKLRSEGAVPDSEVPLDQIPF